MSDVSSTASLSELEARLAELIRESTGSPVDAAVSDRLREALTAWNQGQKEELARLQRANGEAARQLEMHRRRNAVTVHDLKAPITISLLNLELLEMEEDHDQSAFYLTGVRRELEFMLDTIANLLELERGAEEGTALPMEPIPLSQLVDAVVDRMSVLIADKPQLRLENAIPPDLPAIRGQPHRLTRVFNNLFSNAIKYTERGHVRATAETPPGDSCIRVCLEDTGNGIDPERLSKLFNYYEGDSEKLESTGIGLAFVKQVLDAHHGKVWIESARGKGTRVHMELPIWHAKAPPI
jgi:signal transduction histidine kinase